MDSLPLKKSSKRRTKRRNLRRKNSRTWNQHQQGGIFFLFSVYFPFTISFSLPYPRTWAPFFFTDRLLHIQVIFWVAVKNTTVELEYHYTNLSLLGMICTNILMNPTERITNRANENFSGLPIYDIWSLGFILCQLFLVPYFVMLKFNKLIAYCLFLYTIASISFQCLCFYFYNRKQGLKQLSDFKITDSFLTK